MWFGRINGRRALSTLISILRFAFPTAGLAADYVGSSVCNECHTAEYALQSQTHHARALRPMNDSAVRAALLKAGQSPDHLLQYQSGEDGIVVREDGVGETSLLQWAFGAGAQGTTPVGRIGEQFIEHQFSFYARLAGFAPTFGHPLRPVGAVAEMGVLQDRRTITTCFRCHATNATGGEDGPNLTRMLPGVQCERCHGPGSMHVQLARNGAPRDAIRGEMVNPGRLPAKAQIAVCGECHRLPGPDMGDQPELEDPVTVRFAPVGLLASRCFREDKSLSCLTCHSAHANAADRADLSYTRKCLACHAGDKRAVKRCKRRTEQNCLPCHMRQASLGPYLRFTNHRIHVGE